ncbi:Tat pathway signal protein [Clostridium sp. MCC353]|uniref:DUF5722 domain-containing protein n=1 Tax=Clostridium sp. MCC353 TaxID=2592646 RepID=UPI001C035A92|nr:DUF5722 domain-containing protein [Clostridium sp. MCC353]MBT9776930.1 Tat pathway signal protein [Clostridium sp. MCC353]
MKKMIRWIKVGAWAMLAAGLAAVNVASSSAAQVNTEQQAPEKPLPTEQAALTSCLIENGQIKIAGGVEGAWSDPAYYDNYLYLFELQPYQDDLKGRTDYAAWITKGDPVSFTQPLNLGTEHDKLYSKFVLAVFDGEEYIPVSNAVHVTNPEVLAKNKDDFKAPLTKKGLLIEQPMLEDAFELGVKHVIVNIPFHHILGNGIDYTYDGKTYHFNKELMEEYDYTIRRMSEKGMLVTAVILNGWNDATPQLVYPGVTKSSSANYYGFNVSTKEGFETVKAIASFLADRYGDHSSMHGKVSNWIIGNEINNNLNWNYMGKMDIETYVKEYERAFRVFYTAIKSTNKSDRVYFSTDYNWNYEADGSLKYNAKDIVDVFNRNVRIGGQMDWGLAYHPYSIPLTEPEFWDDDQTGLIKNDPSSPVINFSNLSVLTDYLQLPELRMADGNVRHVILSEQGFTSHSATRGKNTDLQAAAFAYAYYITDNNPYIDAFIMSRQVDAPAEAKDSLNFGLWECDMNTPNQINPTKRKKIWTVFKWIDNKKESVGITEFAKPIIGINKWSDVIPNFKYNEN